MQPIAAIILALATLPSEIHALEITTLSEKNWISTDTFTYHRTTAGEPYRDQTTGPLTTGTKTQLYNEEDYSYLPSTEVWTATVSETKNGKLDGKHHLTTETSVIDGGSAFEGIHAGPTTESWVTAGGPNPTSTLLYSISINHTPSHPNKNKMHLPSQVQAQTSFLTTKDWLSTKTNTYQPKTKGQAYGTGPFTTATRTERIYEMDYSEPAKVYSWSRTQTISGKLTSETRKTTFGGSLEKLYHISEA
ncbi:MAG: hypothetical protein Q9162_002920 [Coniocarpon cinnabarinum]